MLGTHQNEQPYGSYRTAHILWSLDSAIQDQDFDFDLGLRKHTPSPRPSTGRGSKSRARCCLREAGASQTAFPEGILIGSVFGRTIPCPKSCSRLVSPVTETLSCNLLAPLGGPDECAPFRCVQTVKLHLEDIKQIFDLPLGSTFSGCLGC